jgi:hypothetical protein
MTGLTTLTARPLTPDEVATICDGDTFVRMSGAATWLRQRALARPGMPLRIVDTSPVTADALAAALDVLHRAGLDADAEDAEVLVPAAGGVVAVVPDDSGTFTVGFYPLERWTVRGRAAVAVGTVAVGYLAATVRMLLDVAAAIV